MSIQVHEKYMQYFIGISWYIESNESFSYNDAGKKSQILDTQSPKNQVRYIWFNSNCIFLALLCTYIYIQFKYNRIIKTECRFYRSLKRYDKHKIGHINWIVSTHWNQITYELKRSFSLIYRKVKNEPNFELIHFIDNRSEPSIMHYIVNRPHYFTNTSPHVECRLAHKISNYSAFIERAYSVRTSRYLIEIKKNLSHFIYDGEYSLI